MRGHIGRRVIDFLGALVGTVVQETHDTLHIQRVTGEVVIVPRNTIYTADEYEVRLIMYGSNLSVFSMQHYSSESGSSAAS